MSTLDRSVRGFVVAPPLALVASLIGAGTAVGIGLLTLAAMLAAAASSRCPLDTLLLPGPPEAMSRLSIEAVH